MKGLPNRPTATISLMLLSTASCLATMTAAADSPPTDSTGGAGGQLISKEELASRYSGIDARDIADGPFHGLYEIGTGNTVSYVTTDGRFLIKGDIIDLTTKTNVSEEHRAARRATLLASIDPATAIVFSPKDKNRPVKHTITIFTDVDCGYCRAFHRNISDVTALGVEVRYVSYPRTGPKTASWAKAEGVWCAKDRQKALTEAKLGADVPPPVAGCNAPVATEYDLGRRIGVTGTPAVYSAGGVDIGGYLTPKQLIDTLEKLEPQEGSSKRGAGQNP